MKHEEIRHKLSEFIDGAITPDELASIEEHLKTCTECFEALRELRKAIEHIHAIEEAETPAWMTQKIMAKVREEAEAKKGIWQRVFAPFLMKFPVQTVAILFLAVTAYYIYTSTNPAQKYSEEPVGTFAKKEAPVAGKLKEERKDVRETAPEAKLAPQKPGYKSLDMKHEYEKPAPPVPQDQMAGSAPAPAKRADQAKTASEADSTDKRALSPKAAAPMMAEQTVSSAGAVQRTETSKAVESAEHKKTKNANTADNDAEARLDITEHFVKFDLPGSMKKKGLQYHARKFETGLADLAWMRKTSSYRSKLCTNRYVVDVDLSGNQSKYLYCYDRSRVTLLGVYELQNGTWSEIN